MKRGLAMLLLMVMIPLAAAATGAPTDAERVRKYLSEMQCPGACTYVMAIIDLYPLSRKALLDMDIRALPELSLIQQDAPGLYRDMAEVFLMEILARRESVADKTEDELAIEDRAQAAMAERTGRDYAPIKSNPEWMEGN